MATHEGPPQSALDLAEKNFRPAAVEADLYEWWERSGFFTPDENAKKPFVMMLPLPNSTGDLHPGHALRFGGYGDLSARCALTSSACTGRVISTEPIGSCTGVCGIRRPTRISRCGTSNGPTRSITSATRGLTRCRRGHLR